MVALLVAMIARSEDNQVLTACLKAFRHRHRRNLNIVHAVDIQANRAVEMYMLVGMFFAGAQSRTQSIIRGAV